MWLSGCEYSHNTEEIGLKTDSNQNIGLRSKVILKHQLSSSKDQHEFPQTRINKSDFSNSIFKIEDGPKPRIFEPNRKVSRISLSILVTIGETWSYRTCWHRIFGKMGPRHAVLQRMVDMQHSRTRYTNTNHKQSSKALGFDPRVI